MARKNPIEILSQILLSQSFVFVYFICLRLYGGPDPHGGNLHKRFWSTFPEYRYFTRKPKWLTEHDPTLSSLLPPPPIKEKFGGPGAEPPEKCFCDFRG